MAKAQKYRAGADDWMDRNATPMRAARALSGQRIIRARIHSYEDHPMSPFLQRDGFHAAGAVSRPTAWRRPHASPASGTQPAARNYSPARRDAASYDPTRRTRKSSHYADSHADSHALVLQTAHTRGKFTTGVWDSRESGGKPRSRRASAPPTNQYGRHSVVPFHPGRHRPGLPRILGHWRAGPGSTRLPHVQASGGLNYDDDLQCAGNSRAGARRGSPAQTLALRARADMAFSVQRTDYSIGRI